MVRGKGKAATLELCTHITTLGSTIAVHILEYLNSSKKPPLGFKELATEFLAASRVLFSSQSGLTEATSSNTELPAGALRDSCGGLDKNEEIIWTDWEFVPGTVSSANS